MIRAVDRIAGGIPWGPAGTLCVMRPISIRVCWIILLGIEVSERGVHRVHTADLARADQSLELGNKRVVPEHKPFHENRACRFD